MDWSLRRRVRPLVEILEDRQLLAGHVISGYVFDDLNGNGIRDAGEAALAGSLIELRNAANVVVATGTTDANGAYRFDTDNTVSTGLQIQTRSVTFGNQTTNTTRNQTVQQFDPSLGILQSVEIRVDGRVVSDIKIENLDDESATVSGNVAGSVLVSGPGFTINTVTNNTSSAIRQLAAYDGTTDFTGGSGVSFGSSSASSVGTKTLTGNQMTPFVGTGTVNLSLLAQAASSASGGGNLLANIASQGGGVVTVTYKYLLDRTLRPGNYTLTQKTQPAGYLDGRESQGTAVLANSIGTDKIAVTLGTTDATENNFGEYRPATLNGHVYHDNNDNGVRDAGEALFSKITVTLTGKDDRNVNVNISVKTDANGYYAFANLRPGVYTITQKDHPKGYGAGKMAVGSLGGVPSGRQFGTVNTAVGATGNDYDFGEFLIRQPNGTGLGKGRFLGSTATPPPVTPPPPPVVTPPPPPVVPPPPAAGGTGSTIGKGRFLGSTTPSLRANPATTRAVAPQPRTAAGSTTGKGSSLGSSATSRFV